MTLPDPTDDDVFDALRGLGGSAYTASVATRLCWRLDRAAVDTTWTFQALRRLAAAGRVRRVSVAGLVASGAAVWETVDAAPGDAA